MSRVIFILFCVMKIIFALAAQPVFANPNKKAGFHRPLSTYGLSINSEISLFF